MKRISLKAAFSSAALLALVNIAYTQCTTGNATCVGNDCPLLGDGAVEYPTGATSDNVNFQSFKADVWTSGYKNGDVSKNTLSSFNRVGTESVRHAVWGPDGAGETSKRAELSDLAIQLHPNKNSSGTPYYYWYGWSLFIPNDANWTSSTLRQYIGQWRFPNTGGCVTMQDCGGNSIGGSGHHLLVDNGKLIFTMAVFDTDCPTSGRLKLIKTDLGAPAKGVWMDIVMQAKWAPTDGRVKFWIQKNGGGYTPAMDYSGPTWLDRFNSVTSCEYNGQEAMAPNWQVGLYWSNDAPLVSTPRVMYSDELKMFRTLCPDTTGSDGWNRARPVAGAINPAPNNSFSVEMESQGYTQTSGDSTTIITDTGAASADKWVKFNANEVNDTVQTTIMAPVGGTYNVKLRAKKYTSRGTAELLINGNSLGTWDQFGTEAYAEKDFGNVVLNTGANTFLWKIRDTNSSSTGYDYSLDKMTFTQP